MQYFRTSMAFSSQQECTAVKATPSEVYKACFRDMVPSQPVRVLVAFRSNSETGLLQQSNSGLFGSAS